MKEEIKGKEDKLERNEQVLATVQGENKKLAEPLKKAKEQVVELQRQLGSQEKEKGALISATAKLKSSQKKVENLSWEVEVLQQKYSRAISKIVFNQISLIMGKPKIWPVNLMFEAGYQNAAKMYKICIKSIQQISCWKGEISCLSIIEMKADLI